MSTEHSAKVFYGTEPGRKLAEWVDEYGCLPCRETGTTGVSIDRFGSAPMGDEQMAVYAHESALRYDPREDTREPRPISDAHEAMSRSAILDLLQRHGIRLVDMAPIGWYLAGRSA